MEMREIQIESPFGEIIDLLLIKVTEDRTIVTRNCCPYDLHSKLSDGLIVRDKIICGHHGCEFSILDG